MNRKIKFRAWHISRKIMATVGDFNHSGKVHVSYQKGEAKTGYFFGGNWVGDDWNENEYVLMQFTGIKDPTGVEIFEGDIMQHANPLDIPFAVNWDEDFLGFVFDSGTTSYNITDPSFYVIGNIYENPELLTAAN
jgi:uncharacterized phage protein (TIGR01671 family)